VKVYYSERFASKYKKLPREIKLIMRVRQKIFFDNPFDPKLKTHKLTGKLGDYCAFSVNRKYRIIFEFIGKETIRLYSVGTHDIYKN